MWPLLMLVSAMLTSSACSPAMFSPPSGPGEPATNAADVWQAATARCQSVTAYSALIALSGSAPRFPTINVTAAFTSAGAAYLQAQHSGKPLFLLAGDGSRAALWLRDDNTITTAPLPDIVHALVDVKLGGEDFLAFLTGCPLRNRSVTDARRYGSLLSIRTADGRAFLDVTTSPRVRAADTRGVLIDYGKTPSPAWPADVSISTETPRVQLRFRPEQVEINETLPTEMFAMPATAKSATPITLEELRKAGPLRR
jgi:hypothetical protein